MKSKTIYKTENGMISIKQIYYNTDQVSLLEEGATPFFNDSHSPSAEREFGIMMRQYVADALFKGATQYEGFISWKFNEKARIPLKSFLQGIENQPGYDVYILNPFPHQVLYPNMWLQGEAHHSGLLEMSQSLVTKAGFDWDLSSSPNIIKNISYCNFWVGNKKFWDLYMKIGGELYQTIFKDPVLNEKFMKPAPGGNEQAPYFAFFFERLITEILNRHPDIKVKSFRYPLEWLKQNFRGDVAEFLHGLPWEGDLQSLIPQDDFKKSKLYLDKLREGRDFYHGQYFNNKLLRLIKKQELLKRFLKNSVTTSLYRRFVKKAVDNIAHDSIYHLS